MTKQVEWNDVVLFRHVHNYGSDGTHINSEIQSVNARIEVDGGRPFDPTPWCSEWRIIWESRIEKRTKKSKR